MINIQVFVCRRQQQTCIWLPPSSLEELARFLFLTIGRAWKLQSDFRGLRIICLHLQKLGLLAAAIVAKWDKREGQDAASAAVHTGQHCTTPVKFNNRADEAKTWKSCEESRPGCLFSDTQTVEAFTLIKVDILSVLGFLWLTLQLHRSRSLNGGKKLGLIGRCLQTERVDLRWMSVCHVFQIRYKRSKTVANIAVTAANLKIKCAILWIHLVRGINLRT